MKQYFKLCFYNALLFHSMNIFSALSLVIITTVYLLMYYGLRDGTIWGVLCIMYRFFTLQEQALLVEQ